MTIIKGFGGGGGGKGGGGGGSARVAQEARDNLRSKAFARVLDLICEGEIVGLVDGAKSIYLDETPLQNPDGSYNFSGLEFASRNGTQWQNYIAGFPAIEAETAVGVEVKKSSAVTRQITNPETDAVRVRISVPQLTSQNTSNGDINGTTVQYQIELQSNGGGFYPAALGRDRFQMWNAGGGVWSSPSEINAAILDIEIFVELGSTLTFDVQRRPKGSSASWTTVETKTYDSTQGYDPWEGQYYYQSNFSYSNTYQVVQANYEFRAIKTAGDGEVAIAQAVGYGVVGYDTVSGKTTSKYERTYRIPLTGDAPWDIRVTRITDDSTSSSLQNKTFWESYTEIVDAKLRYPNSALVGIKIDSAQFSSIPTRAYDMKLMKVKVPSNYNPETRAYSGIWDGTFTVKWTDNPAWCFYDILTNERYGLGGFLDESQIDKWALYTVARYCDELVDDGFGGREPRFTCNMYMQTRAEAYKVMQDMASIFRGMIYWQSGAVTVSQDAPTDPVYLYTPANVIDGVFNYQGSSAKARHTVALVSWNDPEDFYRQKIEYVEDVAGIIRYGVVETSVSAIGCTSRGQANRVGRWLLYSERSESEIVAFKTGLDGMVARPGQIIAIADPSRGGERRGGRVVSATTTAVTLDSAVATAAAGNTLSVILSDGTVETKSVQSVSGAVLTLATALSSAPAAGAIWVLESPNLQSQLFRVVSCVESTDGIEINALAHNPDKFDAIENDIILQEREISVLSAIPSAPINLKVTEALYESSAEVRTSVTLSWDSVSGATSYVVSYKVDAGNYSPLIETSSNSVDIKDAASGNYAFRVQSVNTVGKRSVASEIAKVIFGKTAAPAGVSGFSLVPVSGMAYLTWDKATDLDVLVGGTIRIRHTPDTELQEWNNAVDILPAISGNQTSANAPLLAGTYMAKFVDSSGFSSAAPALIITTVPQALALNVIETLTEDPAFPGTKTNVYVDPDFGGISLIGTDLIEDREDLIDSWGLIDFLGGISPEGTYLFANNLDMGAVYPARLTARIRATGYDTGDLIDARFNNLDEWLDVDGIKADSANATLYMRTTLDDPSGTPTWTEWKPFFASAYTARAFEFKMILTSSNSTHNIAVTDLEVTVDMQDRVLDLQNVVSGAGTYTVSFGEPFHVTPAIGITAESMNTGDYYQISNKTAAGFDIIFKNSAGTAVSRTFDVLAKGYGRRISA